MSESRVELLPLDPPSGVAATLASVLAPTSPPSTTAGTSAATLAPWSLLDDEEPKAWRRTTSAPAPVPTASATTPAGVATLLAEAVDRAAGVATRAGDEAAGALEGWEVAARLLLAGESTRVVNADDTKTTSDASLLS